ncbi:hypothetical protein [Emcibacter sp.]|uniref:hypothetical protein n=1 Tax=Emcibacter sp. TaxID=1979954 RepID=UPI003A902ADF
MKCVVFATLLSSLFMVNIAYADNQIVVVDHNICRQLVPHISDPDVAYKAGEDVRGKKVVPADVPGPTLDIGTSDISFYLVQDLSELSGSNTADEYPGLSQDLILGFVEVRDGTAWLNGKPLSPAQNSEIVYICGKIKSEKAAAEQKR